MITGVSPVTLDDLTSGFNIGTNYSLSFGFNEMVGFTEQEVRQMLSYYSQQYDFNHSVDELIEIMKPYYDNYCFAKEAYGKTTMYNSNKEFAHDASVIQTLVSQGLSPTPSSTRSVSSIAEWRWRHVRKYEKSKHTFYQKRLECYPNLFIIYSSAY